MEFIAQQLLFEALLDIMSIFGSVELLSESTLPFLYIIIFQIWESLEPRSSTLGGDRHMRFLTFLYGIQCSTTFIWTIFGYNEYFWQRRALKWIYFAWYNVPLSECWLPCQAQVMFRCLAGGGGGMAMHVYQIGLTDTAPPCPGSSHWACVGTRKAQVM